MRIILTSSNSRLTQESKELLLDLEGIFPSAEPVPRRGRHFKTFVEEETGGEEALIIRMDQIDVSHRRLLFIRKDKQGDLTTSTFSIVSFVLCRNLSGAVDTGHMPEITLADFDETENDQRIVRDIEDIFRIEAPDFAGRQVVSFTKKRGFIMCRKHRYIIRLPEEETGKEKVRFDEIGPRIAIKLQSVDVNENYIFRHGKNIKIKD